MCVVPGGAVEADVSKVIVQLILEAVKTKSNDESVIAIWKKIVMSITSSQSPNEFWYCVGERPVLGGICQTDPVSVRLVS